MLEYHDGLMLDYHDSFHFSILMLCSLSGGGGGGVGCVLTARGLVQSIHSSLTLRYDTL